MGPDLRRGDGGDWSNWLPHPSPSPRRRPGSYPGTWTLPLDAKAGQTYKVIVEPRGASFGPGLLGPIGGAIDAASNDNAGAFQMRVAQAGGV